MLAVAPARAPKPVGAMAGTLAATSGGAANGLLPNADATGDDADGATADQLGGTDNGPTDVAWPSPADIEEPPPPRPPTPDKPCVPEPRPAAIPNGERPPKPSLPAAAPAAGAKKLALVTVCATCAGLTAPVDVNVFQMFALGPHVLHKLLS